MKGQPEPSRMTNHRSRSGTASRISVLLDASQLTGQSAFSGIGTYVRNLLDGLVRYSQLEVRALATPDAQLPVGVIQVPTRRWYRQGRIGVCENEVKRTLEVRLNRPRVFHNPNPHAPLLPPGRWVQTLHDVIPLVSNDPIMEPLRRRFERFGPRYASADAVIAISHHAASEGMRLLGIPSGKIRVIYHGVPPEFVPASDGPQSDPPYVTVVSEYSSRKGFFEAFEVIAEVAEAHLPHRLKVIGRVPSWEQSNFAADLARARRPDRIDVLGFVNNLPAIYRGATAHLITSHYEGFGFPAIEAMASGTPVVAYRNTALPEVVGTGGVLVPDGDVPAFTRALLPILRVRGLREELSRAALQQAANFTWEESARAHAEVFREVALR